MWHGEQGVAGPFGLDAGKGQTVAYQRTVLVVVHHVTSATRLADVVPLLEADRRVQVVYTWAPASVFGGGVQRYLARLGGVVIPWRQAAQVRFDLAVAAAYGLLANRLMRLPDPAAPPRVQPVPVPELRGLVLGA